MLSKNVSICGVLILWMSAGLAVAQAQDAQTEGRRDGRRTDNADGNSGDRQRDSGRRRDRSSRDRGRRGDGQDATPRQPGDTRQDNGPPPGEGNGDRGPRGDRGDRGGRGGPPSFSPEQRERFYGQMVDRYMERATETYGLSEEQKTAVRAKLDQAKAAQKAYSEPRTAQFQSLFSEMRQMRDTERSGGQVDPEKRKALEDQFRKLRDDSPLMNADNVVKQVESVLPPAQVERGHAKWEADSRESDRRREEMRTRWEQGRTQRDSAAPGAEGAPPAGDPGGPPPEPGADGRSWRDGGRGDRGFRGDDRGDRGDRGSRGDWRGRRGDGDQVGAATPDQQGMSEEARLERSERPVGPWEQYVRDFTRTYKLDAAQQATAESVLREVKERRTTYEQAHRLDFDSARKGSSKSLEELNKPVVAMFDELKLRLMRIPSSAQRQAAGYIAPRPAPTSRPAAVTSRAA